jgi:predicted nucleic acid-binding Zn ribbon protein
MHKKSLPDKKTGARNRRQTTPTRPTSAAVRPGKLNSVNELLSHRTGLRRIVDSIPAQLSWAEWLRGALAAPLAAHIVSAVPKSGELVVFADSPAWATRLRYALAALLPQISARDAAIARMTVRVQMRSESGSQVKDGAP